MGPYCKFCNQRCFVPITDEWPKHIAEAYGRHTIAATCPGGQRYEKERLGYSWDDVVQTVNAELGGEGWAMKRIGLLMSIVKPGEDLQSSFGRCVKIADGHKPS